MKYFEKLNYSFLFWFYFALITIILREYYFEEKIYIYHIFPSKIDILFSLAFFGFIIYSFTVFVLVLKKSKNTKTNSFLVFIGNLTITLHLAYTTYQSYSLINLTLLKDYHISTQIKELRKTLPISVNSFTDLIDISKNENQISYIYKLNKLKIDIETLDLRSFKNGIHESLCNENYSLDVLKHNYTLNYKYLDKNKEKIIDVNTTKEDCGDSIYDLDYLKLIMTDKKI